MTILENLLKQKPVPITSFLMKIMILSVWAAYGLEFGV